MFGRRAVVEREVVDRPVVEREVVERPYVERPVMASNVDDVGVTERRVVWAAWSPAQLVALGFGVLYLIMSVAALARTGLSGDSFTTTHTTALGFAHTPLLAVIELVFGLLLIMAGAVPGAGRGTMALLGTLALGFGVVILAASTNLYDTLGVDSGNGWLYVITGVVTLAAAIAAPVFLGSDRRSVGYQQDVVSRRRFL
ncbi:MAG: DUF4383 domain-containing protein [Dehalococcoidia bacterium]